MSETEAGAALVDVVVDVGVDVGLESALVVIQFGLEGLVELAFERGVLGELLLFDGLGAELVFEGGLGFGHGGAELLFGEQLVASGAGVDCGGLLAGDTVAVPGKVVLVGLEGLVPVQLVAGFGALQVLVGLSPRGRAAEFALEFGGVASQLVRLGAGPLGQGFVGGGLGLEPFAAAGLPPAGAFGVELLVGRAFGSIAGLCESSLPAALDRFDRALAFRVDPQPM